MTGTVALKPGARVFLGERVFVVVRCDDLEWVWARDEATGERQRIRAVDLSSGPAPANCGEGVGIHVVSEAHWSVARTRKAAIEPLLHSGRTRRDVLARSEEVGTSSATLYRWITAYESTGTIDSLLPGDRPGGRGKPRIDPRTEQVIAETIESKYNTSQRKRAKKIVDDAVHTCSAEGILPPGKNTVYRRIAALDPRRTTERRHGRAAARQEYDLLDGPTPGAGWPHAIVEIDHTPVDVHIVDERLRLTVGRPWITLVIDVFSRMVLGFYLSLDPPGYTSVAQAIVSAVLPKQRWMKRFNIPDDWPCWGLPETLHSDNGAEFRSRWLERVAEKYQLGLMYRPAGRPNFGGHIERLLGVSLQNIHNLPGASFSNPRHRAGYDSEGLAAFTLPELEEWFGLWITGIYHNTYHSGICTTPLQQYRKGILGDDEQPGRGYPVRIEDEETFRIEMLPSVERTITKEGVAINGIFYRSDDLRPMVGRRELGRARRKPKYMFHLDYRDISRIYFFSPVAKRYVVIPYRDVGHPPVSVWELRAARRALRAEGMKHVDEKAIFRAYARQVQLEEAAVSRTRTARRKKAVRAHHQEAHDGLPACGPMASEHLHDRSLDVDFDSPVVLFEDRRGPGGRPSL